MIDVVMPQMGESIVEGTLTKWLKKPGEHVDRDEQLFEISTDKVDTEIPAVHVAQPRQALDRLRHIVSSGDDDRHVDDRFRRQTRDGSAADVFDAQRDISNARPDALPQHLEVARPGRIVVDDDDGPVVHE